MKQVFECGITGTSNDEVGDYFLAHLAGIPLPHPTPERKMPDDFIIEIQDRQRMLDDSGKYIRLFEGMMERGYEVMRWRDHDKFCEVVRFRRASQ